jgi:tRNA(fMet)-specific endonuclease VapC
MNVIYLIDTDWVIDYFNDAEPVASKIEELVEMGTGISIISLAELYEGIYNSRDVKLAEDKLIEFLSDVVILEINEEICKIFGKERGKLRKRGAMIGDFDLIIASTALYYNIPLCTNNRKHYKNVDGLEIVTIHK